MLESLLKNLNAMQLQAVTSSSNNLLVLAGAGSGKTKVLISRLVWLVKQQNLPLESVMAVTFTNKAAGEMKHRLQQYAPINYYSSIGTFHSLANKFLKTHWEEAKLEQNFQIISADEQLRVIKILIKDLDLDEKHWQANQFQWYINNNKENGVRAKDLVDDSSVVSRTRIKVYLQYEKQIAKHNIVDFTELLLRNYEVLNQNSDLLAFYHDKIKHILVDEFQDTNSIQYKWLKLLVGNNNITVVGDDDQSIYGWRGAKIENINKFSTDFAKVEVVRLEQNYRSTDNILQAANQVIANNSNRLGKKLWTEGESGEKIILYTAVNELDESRFVVSNIERLKNNNRAFKEMAVLYRSNAQSRVIEELLIRAQIPYKIYGGQRFYDRAEIRNALAYLKIAVGHTSDWVINRTINTPARGIGARTIEIVTSFASEKQISFWQAMQEIVYTDIPTRTASIIQNYISLVHNLQSLICVDLPISQQADKVINACGLIEFYQKAKDNISQNRLENLTELVNAVYQFDLNVENANLIDFLNHVSLDSGDLVKEEDCVHLMTLHSAKGLEFPIVFLTGLEDGLFPHGLSINDPAKLEEERRLCYVGITRAMEKLYLSYAEIRRIHGKEIFNSISRFVKEIPDSLLDKIVMNANVQTTNEVNTENENKIQPGKHVMHSIFGRGIVLQLHGHGDNAKVEVQFATKGKKWLLLSYANLETI